MTQQLLNIVCVVTTGRLSNSKAFFFLHMNVISPNKRIFVKKEYYILIHVKG